MYFVDKRTVFLRKALFVNSIISYRCGKALEYPDEIGNKEWKGFDLVGWMADRAVGWVERSLRRWVSL